MRTPRACVVRLGGLTTEVATAYDDLRCDRRQPWLRVEQQREGRPQSCPTESAIDGR
jgi:hypothetical protein